MFSISLHLSLSGQCDIALFNDVDDVESTCKSIISLKSKQMGKLINRIPGMSLFISSLPGPASRMHVRVLEALPGKLDIKRHSPSILYVD